MELEEHGVHIIIGSACTGKTNFIKQSLENLNRVKGLETIWFVSNYVKDAHSFVHKIFHIRKLWEEPRLSEFISKQMETRKHCVIIFDDIPNLQKVLAKFSPLMQDCKKYNFSMFIEAQFLYPKSFENISKIDWNVDFAISKHSYQYENTCEKAKICTKSPSVDTFDSQKMPAFSFKTITPNGSAIVVAPMGHCKGLNEIKENVLFA
jgi:hypothetical protein